MKNRLKNINFYLTSIDIGSSIDNLVDSGTFVIKDTTVNGFSLTNGDQLFYVIVDADQTLKREIFRITNVNTATKVVTFDKRISPNGKQAHAANALVQINDFAELFNYLSLHTDDAGYSEIVTGRYVKVFGGVYRYETSNVTVSDTTLLMDPNTTNYIILDFADGTLKFVTSLTGLSYYLIATAVTNGTDVLSLTDNRSTFVGFDTAAITPSISVGSVTTLAPALPATVTNVGTTLAPIFNFGIPKGDAGTIADAPEGEVQTIRDHILPDTGAVVTTNDTTYVRVTRVDNSYTEYNLTGIEEHDVNGALLTGKGMVGVFGVDGITYAINNSDVDKVTGIYTFDGNPAYVNMSNTFHDGCVFDDTAAFKGLALFPYYTGNAVNTSAFDATNGSKQLFTFNDSGSHTLTFTSLRSGGNYIFAINVTGGTATLNKAVSFTDCDTITTMYTVEPTSSYPRSLAVGTHLFVAEAFSTAIHVSYLGTSVAA